MGQRSVLLHGFVILAIGFALGLVIPATTGADQRLWLGSHVTGILVGVMMIAVGSAWSHLRLGDGARRALWVVTVPSNYVSVLILGIFAPLMRIPTIATPELAMPAGPVMAVFGIGLLNATISAFVMCGLAIYGLRGDDPVSA
jgi:hypothetical protein